MCQLLQNCTLHFPFNKRYCTKCSPYREFNKDITLKDAIYIKHHRSSAFALVRLRARATAKKLGWNKCSKCPYDKHFEVGHIKPIKDFDESTLLSVINHPSNLIALCPNCHWEHDHNL